MVATLVIAIGFICQNPSPLLIGLPLYGHEFFGWIMGYGLKHFGSFKHILLWSGKYGYEKW